LIHTLKSNANDICSCSQKRKKTPKLTFHVENIKVDLILYSYCFFITKISK
jgi:hypothetical protein